MELLCLFVKAEVFMSHLSKFQAALSEAGFDAAIVSDHLNQRYLSGFDFEDGLVLVTKGQSYLITDFRYVEAAKAQNEEKPANGADDALAAEIMAQIEARAAAKKAKNYAEADRIRNELAAKGITLIDTPQGTTFKIN